MSAYLQQCQQRSIVLKLKQIFLEEATQKTTINLWTGIYIKSATELKTHLQD